MRDSRGVGGEAGLAGETGSPIPNSDSAAPVRMGPDNRDHLCHSLHPRLLPLARACVIGMIPSFDMGGVGALESLGS